MLRLTKKIEYALIALQYMAQRRGQIVTSKEIAEYCHLSAELVAKVLSALARGGIVGVFHGVRGGFVLERNPATISLEAVIRSVEGHHVHLIQCEEEYGPPCSIEPHCTIRSPLRILQMRIERIFESVTIADLLELPTVELELPDE